jgi:hypothetical protein
MVIWWARTRVRDEGLKNEEYQGLYHGFGA